MNIYQHKHHLFNNSFILKSILIMNMLNSIILLLMVQASISTCFEGCLSCEGNSKCRYTDLINSYILEDDTAVKSNVENCDLIGVTGNCLQCKKDYFHNVHERKCVFLTETQRVENCLVHLNIGQCMACKSGYFLGVPGVVNDPAQFLKCLPANPVIENCFSYNGKSCVICKEGYIPNHSNSACIADPRESACLNYSYVKCRSCSQNYIYNPNAFIKTLIDSIPIPGFTPLLETLSNTQIELTKLSEQITCNIPKPDHCESAHIETGTCIVCESGYYLSNNLCVIFPDNKIKNCQEYLTKNQCRLCDEDYFIDAGGCKAITENQKIDFCERYDSSSLEVDCLLCEANYFLNEGICEIRLISVPDLIENCEKNHPSADECLECESGYVLTNSNRECRKEVLDCVKHFYNTADQSFKCEKCKDGYYLQYDQADPELVEKGGNCLKGQILNCAQYELNSDTICLECVNGYVIDQGQCSESNVIENCFIYHSTDKTQCTQCDPMNSFSFFINNKCQSISKLIDKCLTYNGGTAEEPVCEVCSLGYELENNECVEIPIDFCIATNDDQTCSKCLTDKIFSDNGLSCVSIPEFVKEGCNKLNMSLDNPDQTITELECVECSENSYPIDFKDQFVCLRETEIQSYKHNATVTENCIKYNEQFECVQCDIESLTPYLSPNPPYNCLPNCSEVNPGAAYNKVILQTNTENIESTYQIDQYEVCNVNDTDTGCLVYAPNLNSDTLSDICIECRSDYLEVIDLENDDFSPINPKSTNSSEYVPSPFSKFPLVSCVLKGSNVHKDDALVDSIDNCKYYAQHTDTTYACVKCKSGFTGVPSTYNNNMQEL